MEDFCGALSFYLLEFHHCFINSHHPGVKQFGVSLLDGDKTQDACNFLRSSTFFTGIYHDQVYQHVSHAR